MNRLLMLCSMIFFPLALSAHPIVDKLHDNMLSVCLEDQSEELCRCVAGSFRDMLDKAALPDEDYNTIYNLQNGQDVSDERLAWFDSILDFDTHEDNVRTCLQEFEAIY